MALQCANWGNLSHGQSFQQVNWGWYDRNSGYCLEGERFS
ncbi:hypothetical protein D051_5632 [Vibrio parahaemolyticus VPCR-2010]|nr:hypothetical protein D051_5632 [Vibrio parahaemolyticus VPCR-2010]